MKVLYFLIFLFLLSSSLHKKEIRILGFSFRHIHKRSKVSKWFCIDDRMVKISLLISYGYSVKVVCLFFATLEVLQN